MEEVVTYNSLFMNLEKELLLIFSPYNKIRDYSLKRKEITHYDS